MKKSLYIAAALLTLAACSRVMNIDTPAGDMIITARTETSADTRTVVEGETHVYWEPGDEIAVFADGQSAKFTTDITSSSATAEFKGTMGVTGDAGLWAVYPYSKDAVFDGETITTVLPSEQVARAGSFGKEMNLAIANSTTSDLQFYNVGGGIRFSLSQDGITKVVLQGLNGEALAGKVRIGFQNGIPVIQEVTEEKTSISITTPDGGAFKNNCWYYIVAIPGALENGFIMSFRKDGVMGSREFDRAVTIKRGIFGTLSRADKEPGTSYTVPDAVDLGLPSGLKWASFNLGASKPEEYGAYYAWGETEPKDDYSWETYKWCMGSNTTMTKYCTTSPHGSFGNNGFTDNKTILDPEDDAAHVNLGGKWRMATYEECVELRENCTWTWTTQNGVNGSLITGPNGNSIFLPAAGNWFGTDLNEEGSLGGTWGSSLDTFYPYTAWGQAYNEEWVIAGDMGGDRYVGCTIRPVYDDGTVVPPPTTLPDPVDLGLSVKWASFNLGATRPEEYGDYYAWGETAPYYSDQDPLTWKEGKEAGYDWVSYKWCMGSKDTMTKYCNRSEYGYNGFTDTKTVLDPEDDAAHVNLGGTWRIPTDAEWTELRTNCTWEWTKLNEVNCYKVTSNKSGYTDKYIFLPAAGDRYHSDLRSAGSVGHFWSSTIYTGRPGLAWGVYFGSSQVLRGNQSRCYGYSVRPVSE